MTKSEGLLRMTKSEGLLRMTKSEGLPQNDRIKSFFRMTTL